MVEKKFLSGKEAEKALFRENGRYALELVHNLVGGFAEDQRKLMGDVPEEDHNWEPVIERFTASVAKITNDGNMFVVMQNDKPVGMQGFKHIGKDPTTNREIYELSHGSILEEGEGKGYLTELVSLAIQDIRKNFSGADILFGSANLEFAKRLAARLQFDPISLEHFYQIKYSKSDVSLYTEDMEKQNDSVQYYILPADKEIHKK